MNKCRRNAARRRMRDAMLDRDYEAAMEWLKMRKEMFPSEGYVEASATDVICNEQVQT